MRPSYVDIDLGSIAHNTRTLADFVAPTRLCAVVKADAYGHGDVPVAETALANGAEWLAVALVEEGARLREGGITAPILLLSEPPVSSLARLVHWRLTPTVYRSEFVDALVEMGAGVGGLEPLAVHLKVDTGMHRVGADPDTAMELAQRLVDSPTVDLEGVWTHFAVADEDVDFTRLQLERFRDFLARLEAAGIPRPLSHASNTAGALLGPEAAFDMVRTGIGLYGLYPNPADRSAVELRPAMRIVSEVSHVRHYPAGTRLSYGRRRPLPVEGTVATVPIGYADGVPRRLALTGAEVLIHGRRFPLAGTVTMDQILVDVNNEPVEVGDEVVLLGTQGDQEISVDEWAEQLETINYEIVCQVGPRLPRRDHS